MLTGKIRSQIDQIWNAFWTGGISDPMTVIQQISYLLFIRRLDDLQKQKEAKANLTGVPIEDPIYYEDQKSLRWSVFKDKDPQSMFELVRDEVFPFIKTLGSEESAFTRHMKDAIFMIPKPALLDQVVQMIDKINMEDRDTKGDLYEYLLSKLTTAGVNGQFRTPRHIIKMMVNMMRPTLTDTICDPAAGTCGFLMMAEEYVRDNYRQELTKKANAVHFNNEMFTGFDFDSSMLRIGAMNMMLHGVEHPRIEYRDSLSDHNEANIADEYTIILANPPFKGSVDFDSIAPDLLRALGKTPKAKQAKSKTDEEGKKTTKQPTEKSELLFIALMLRMLKPGGRAAVIVPDGVVFGSTNAHQTLRRKLVEEQKLDAVISMPSGVFKPYAGVSTAVLLFTKTNSGGTDKVWFYDMQADGYSLDDKRNPLTKDGEEPKHEQNNIPDILARWDNLAAEYKRACTEQSFMVSKDEIVANAYDLSINRYKEVVYEEVKYDKPKEIIERIKTLQKQMNQGLAELEGYLA